MRLKADNVCCAFAWSPASLGTPAMLATASYIGAMDDDFTSEGYLDIRLVDVTNTDETSMTVVGRTRIPDRACRVDWSPHTGRQGIIAVACGNGSVYVYCASAILGAHGQGTDVAPLCELREHRGAVHGCQFNQATPHILSTGGDDGKWYIWNLQEPSQPSQIQIVQDATAHNTPIVHLQWHPNYSFILATVSADGVVNVWNLKMGKLVKSLNTSKASHGAGATTFAWNPTHATQFAIGFDDGNPTIQLWELKQAMSPKSEMRGHNRGVSSLAWNAQDTSMLASCDGEGRTVWWDPATGHKTGELQKEANAMVDVQWCPVLPAVLATSSFEPLLCVSTAQDVSAAACSDPAAVPKWLKKPCGASINFALNVASLIPGTTNSVGVTALKVAPMSPKSNADQQFQRELQRVPPGSQERVEWLEQHHYGLLAAVASSRNSRQPILDYLNEKHGSGAGLGATIGSNPPGEDDDPFAEMTEEQQKSYEDRAAEFVASGRLEEAVDVCLDSGHYDDAFSIAFLSGAPLMAKVHQHYVAYVTKQHPERRHVQFAGAIASGDFTQLVNADIPWKEALSAIIAFVVDGFADACNNLGDVLKAKQNYEGAYACYVCSRNVDAVVDLWRLQQVPSRKVVQDVRLLEETTERQATSQYLAACLCDYGLKLVADGHPQEACEYLERAARIGDHTAAVLADRIKYLVPSTPNTASAFPFRMEAIADQPSQSCMAFLSSAQSRQQQHPQQQAYPPQQQQQQQVAPQPPQPQQHTPPLSRFPPSSQPPLAMPPPGRQPTPPMPNMQQPPQQPPQQQQQQQPPMMPTRGPSMPTLGSAVPPSAMTGGAPPPPPSMMMGGGLGKRPPLMPSAGPAPAMPPQQQHGLPPSSHPTPPMAGAAPQLQPPMQPQQQQPPASSSALPGHGIPPPPPPAPGAPPGRPSALPSSMIGAVGAPQPRLMPHPISRYSSLQTPTGTGSAAAAAPPPPPPSGGAPPRMPSQPQQQQQQPQPLSAAPPPMMPMGGGGGMPPQQMPRPGVAPPQAAPAAAAAPTSLSAIDPAQFGHPQHQALVQALQHIVPQIPDPTKRNSVEQAAVVLCQHMAQGRLPDEVVQLLLEYVRTAGTPASRAAWQQLSGRYFTAIQPFYNLRLL